MTAEEETHKLGQAVLYCVHCGRTTNFVVGYHIDHRTYVCRECGKAPPESLIYCPKCQKTTTMIQIEEWIEDGKHKWAYHLCTRRGCHHKVNVRESMDV